MMRIVTVFLVSLISLSVAASVHSVATQKISTSSTGTQPGVICGAYGYDLTPLTQIEFTYNDISTWSTWYFRPCGVAPHCAVDASSPSTSMTCTVDSNNATTPLIPWNPSAEFSWAPLSRGVMAIYWAGSCDLPGGSLVQEMYFYCAETTYLSTIRLASACLYQSYIYTPLACTSSVASSTALSPTGSSNNGNAICSYGDYNLMDIATDYSLDFDGFTWYLSLCGSISHSTSLLCSDPSVVGPSGSMLCFIPNDNPSTSYSVASYNLSSAYPYSNVIWATLPNNRQGIQYTVSSGTICGSGSITATVIVQVLCDASYSQPTFATINEYSPCQYQAIIYSPTVCSPTCHGVNYDVSGAAVDLHISSNVYDWWIHPCGVITSTSSTQCNRLNSMFCQVPVKSPNTAYNLAYYNYTAGGIVWSGISNGVQFTVEDGDLCPNGNPRQSIVQFLCSYVATSPSIISVTEWPQCVYTVVIYTITACNQISSASSSTGSARPAFSSSSSSTGGPGFLSSSSGGNGPTCISAGYDMSSTAIDLSLIQGDSVYYLRPCGTLSARASPLCANPSTNPYGSSFCKVIEGVSTMSKNIAIYNSSNSITWMSTSNGAQYTVQLSSCDGLSNPIISALTVEFVCNVSATRPWFASVSSLTCVYYATIHTDTACVPTHPLSQYTVGSVYRDNLCGGAFDLSQLIGRGDLVYQNLNYSDQFLLNICGRIISADCSDVQPTSFCIAAPKYSHVVSLGYYDPNQLHTYRIESDGLMLLLPYMGGLSCYNAEITIRIICDGTTPPQFVRVDEKRCVVSAIVRASCRSLIPVVSSSSSSAVPALSTASISSLPSVLSSSGSIVPDDSSSRTSLSSGAMAGIVVASIIGAALVVTVFILTACVIRLRNLNQSVQKQQLLNDSSSFSRSDVSVIYPQRDRIELSDRAVA